MYCQVGTKLIFIAEHTCTTSKQNNFVNQAPEKNNTSNQLLLSFKVNTTLIINYVEVLPG